MPDPIEDPKIPDETVTEDPKTTEAALTEDPKTTEAEEDIDLDKVEVETRTAKPQDDPKKEEDDEDIDPDDEKTISKIVDKKLSGVSESLKQLQSLKDANEVDALIRTSPEYSKYREVALKYMAHPSYANIPAKNIMAIVASNDLQKLGAQKEREAAKKAADTKGGGDTTRDLPTGKVDWANMSKEQFEIEKSKVLQGGNRQ